MSSESLLSARVPAVSVSAVLAAVGLVLSVAGCGNSKPAGGGDGGNGDGGTQVARSLLILHTNDLHSHFMGQAPERDYTPASIDDDLTTGGVARLASAIGSAKATAAAGGTPVLLLDAGDFMMGTLFELLAVSQAPELRFMQAAGYDATTIGNHELDWTPRGLAGILSSAVAADVTVPILASNMTFSQSSSDDDDLQALADAGVIKAKLIKSFPPVDDGTTKAGRELKIGFFGLLGRDAQQVTPQAAPLSFEPIAAAAARMVNELRNDDKVDLVIALSHSGINSAGEGEDAVLARTVPGIDLIISGHTHDSLEDPKVIGNTVIVTAGSYGRYLGHLNLTVTPADVLGGRPTVVVAGYTLQNIDDKVPGDSATQAQIDGMIAALDGELASSNLSYRKVVAKTGSDLGLPPFAEAPLGNLVTDAYRTIGGALQPTEPPQIAVEANGQLRAPILKGTTGDIWFADLFRVTPLGIGPDGIPGAPLVTFYLNAKDIRSGLELGAAPGLISNDYFLQLSGVKVEYDMSKVAFGRVSSLKLVTGTTEQTLDITNTTQCYKIIATNFVAGLLGVVESSTNRALSVAAKDKDCVTRIDPTTRFVDADPVAPGIQELKQWQATLKYVSAFPPLAGVPTVPVTYATPQGRIVKK